jgi:fructose-specific component phosphotransferase system IIB-like protein
VAEIIEQVLRHRAPFSSRHRIIDTKGDTHVVVVVGDRLYGDDGQLIGTAGFYVDVTESFEADVRHTLHQAASTFQETRAIISQALGIITMTYGVSADRARDVLAWRSREANVRQRDIAAQFVAEAAAASLPPRAQPSAPNAR